LNVTRGVGVGAARRQPTSCGDSERSERSEQAKEWTSG
jgi:hypothetical protein